MATEPKKPPKGILKKTTAPAPTTATTAKASSAVKKKAVTSLQAAAEDSDPDSDPDDARKANRRPRTDEDAREIATQHARIIHSRRVYEDAIADSIIQLAKLPTGQPSPAATASPTTTTTEKKPRARTEAVPAEATPDDVATFKSLVRAFQPSDYDDLLGERNALGRCGYALCGRPARRLPSASTFKLVNWGRADFGIVPREELERWCSGQGAKKCARRAMYVKVQLNETAAWERAGIDSIAIDLLEEVEAADEERKRRDAAPATATGSDQATDAPERERVEVARREKEDAAGRLEAQRKAARDARDLAIERGDIPSGPKAAAAAAASADEPAAVGDNGDNAEEDDGEGDEGPTRAPGAATGPTTRSVKIAIREKRVMIAPQEPGADGEGGIALAGAKADPDGHLVLDGYKTKFDPKSHAVTGLMPSAKEEALREAAGEGEGSEGVSTDQTTGSGTDNTGNA